jgi:hypothetical protein
MGWLLHADVCHSGKLEYGLGAVYLLYILRGWDYEKIFWQMRVAVSTFNTSSAHY